MTDKEKIKKHTEDEKIVGDDKLTEANGSAEEENPAESADDSLKELQAKLEAAEEKSKENYERLLRISAEFENYKKRSAREMEDFKKFANESLIKEILPVVDNLERAIESSANNGNGVSDSITEGVEMTLKEILKIFEKFGVKPVTAMGEVFNPALHQAMMQEESEAHPENTVLREFQKGYTMNDRLLRPSMVVVSKAKSENAA
jgi:molecular chaperone GrpE